MVVTSDREVSGSKVYRGENAVGTFLSNILQEEVKIRESLAAPKPMVMADEDWEKFKKAPDCHICNKSLTKDEFLDSLPVWNIEEAGEEGSEKCILGLRPQKMFLHGTERAEMGCSKAKKTGRQKRRVGSKITGKL